MSDLTPSDPSAPRPSAESSPSAPAAPPPGWYDDAASGGQRWWDGRGWSDFRRASPAPTAAPAGPQIIVTAPPKKKVNHGLHLILSLVTFGLWLPVWLIIAIAA